MSMFDSSLAQVAIVADVPLPVNVASGPGIAVDKTNAIWTIGLDTMSLVEDTTVADPSKYYFAAFDTALGMYERVRLDNMVAAATGLDTRQPIVDAPYNVTVHDRYVALTMALTAPRIIVMPPANSVPGGREVMIEDEVGGLSSVNYFTVEPTGTDTISGKATYVMATPYGGARFRSNGTNAWSVVSTSNFYLVPATTTAYTASPDDNVIAFPAFTAPVTATLPAAAAYPKGRRLTIADRNGSCTPTNTMTVVRAGTDTINGVAAPAIASMNAPYSTITLFSDGVSAWTVAGGGNITAGVTVTSAQISDASTLGRQLLTNTSASTDRTALGSGAVGDAVFTSTTQVAAQGALGLGTMATQASNGVNITGGNIAGVAISGGTNTNSTITTPTINSPTMSGGTIDNTVIGAMVPAGASVTSLNGGQLAGMRNLVINGLGRIDQRNANVGVTPGTGATYFGDRWSLSASQASKLNMYSGTSLGTVIGNGINVGIVASVASAYTPVAADYFILYQVIEGLNSARLGWGTASASPITLSFWANSPVAGTYCVTLGGGGGRYYCANFTLAASVWTYVKLTIPGDTAGTWKTDNTAGLTISFNLGCGSNYIGTGGVWGTTNLLATAGAVNLVAHAGAQYYITGVQVEAGTVATPFEHRLIATEMLNCQRYYEPVSVSVRGYMSAAGYVNCTVYYVTKRASPTATLITAGTHQNVSGVYFIVGSPNTAYYQIANSSPGDTYSNFELYGVSAEL